MTTYIMNQALFCVSKSRGAVEQLACIPGASLQIMGAVCCAVCSNTCTQSDFCVSSHSFCDDFSHLYQPREVSWPSGAFFLAFWHRPEYALGVGADITRASCLPATSHFTSCSGESFSKSSFLPFFLLKYSQYT